MKRTLERLDGRLKRIEEALVRLETKMDGVPTEKVYGDTLDLPEAAEFLGEAVNTLYGRCSRREIPFYKRGRKNYFRRADLEKWMEGGRLEMGALYRGRS